MILDNKLIIDILIYDNVDIDFRWWYKITNDYTPYLSRHIGTLVAEYEVFQTKV